MITKVARGKNHYTEIDWDEMFDHSNSDRNVTQSFAMGVYNSKEWLECLRYKPSREAATFLSCPR